jgi:hypothetical protein
MHTAYGVYLMDSKSPMAIFIREDWAIDWQKRMQKKNPSALLYVRPSPRAADLPLAATGCKCFVPLESYNACPVHGKGVTE